MDERELESECARSDVGGREKGQPRQISTEERAHTFPRQGLRHVAAEPVHFSYHQASRSDSLDGTRPIPKVARPFSNSSTQAVSARTNSISVLSRHVRVCNAPNLLVEDG